MSGVVVVADGGSTKCHWVIFGGGVDMDIVTEGVNPVIMSAEQIFDVWSGALAHILPRKLGFEAVHYYGAGCVGGDANEKVRQALRRLTWCDSIEVCSDMLGAARATLRHSAGVACILGTGCNSCLYDGRDIASSIRPLGYILGDEGSGADIGKHIVADALKGLLPTVVTEAFFRFADADYRGIIDRIYSQPRANAYLATFARFAAQWANDASVSSIVRERLDMFLRRNVLLYPPKSLSGGVSFVGGVAHQFEDALRGACAAHGLEVKAVVADPVAGERRYHSVWEVNPTL